MTTNRIDVVQKIKGLSLKEFAEKMGITTVALSYLKTGKRRLSLHHIEKMAEILECYPSDLMPAEWQRPEKESAPLNEALMHCIITRLINEQERLNTKFSPETIAYLSISHYRRALENPDLIRDEKIAWTLKDSINIFGKGKNDGKRK